MSLNPAVAGNFYGTEERLKRASSFFRFSREFHTFLMGKALVQKSGHTEGPLGDLHLGSADEFVASLKATFAG